MTKSDEHIMRKLAVCIYQNKGADQLLCIHYLQDRIQTSVCRRGGYGRKEGTTRRKTIFSVLEWLGRLSLALFCKKNCSFQ